MIIRRILVPLIAFFGIGLGVYTIAETNKPVKPAEPASPPVTSPFAQQIAASGLVEPASEEIHIGASIAGIVSAVYVKTGDELRPGDPLFLIDDRDTRARLAVSEARVKAARARLSQLEQSPRPERLPPAQALVEQRLAELEAAQVQLRTAEAVKDSRAISRETLERRKAAVAGAKAAVLRARAELALIKAGTWKAELAVARAELGQAQAELSRVKVELDRLMVRAPILSRVLQVNVKAGEFASAGPSSTPLLIIGDTRVLHIRADIDEYDSWRYKPGTEAIAVLRGNGKIKAGVRFVRIEPLIVPKKSLSGQGSERVDTRVLQVIFAFDPGSFPARPGQQVDVFIRAAGKGPQ